VSFTAPASNGGTAITSYTVTGTSTTGDITVTGTATGSPITVTGLTPGYTYTFTVTATNSVGNRASISAIEPGPRLARALRPPRPASEPG
jgi:Fibronectin type III domain